ncbi:YceI family protein [Marivirga sp. S37H4]|uniref:YceI family protein n=1 Tax=Marivirga aurantiaca TaxID=2802615 RepID=A0A934X077_9BACT|nr:YceI family protein [Marivirga aurantiaca]MBK6266254.1 YceI family protein [Marivirga aurantiaca]
MKILKTTSLYVFALLLVAACTSNEKKDEAKVSEEEEVTVSEGNELTISNEEASMEFVGTKPTGRHYGNIALADGTIKVKDGEVTGGKLVFDINKITITDLQDDEESHGKLVGHLQSDDFFDAANHPTATFEIVSVKSIQPKDDVATSYNSYSNDMQQPEEGERIMELEDFELEGATHEIKGNLTMRGKTLAITVPARIDVTEDSVKAFTNFSIDRTDWGLMYGDEAKAVDKAQDKFIYNTVGVGFDLKAANEQTM